MGHTYYNKQLIFKADLGDLGQETLQEVAEKGRTFASEEALKKKFAAFRTGRKERCAQNRLISGQRYNFVRFVYSLVDIELSVLILCPPTFPSLQTGHLHSTLYRAASRHSEDAGSLREDLADVAAQFPPGEGVQKLMKTYKYSLNYFEVQRWRAGDASPHGLLNVVALRKRFQKSDEMWRS